MKFKKSKWFKSLVISAGLSVAAIGSSIGLTTALPKSTSTIKSFNYSFQSSKQDLENKVIANKDAEKAEEIKEAKEISKQDEIEQVSSKETKQEESKINDQTEFSFKVKFYDESVGKIYFLNESSEKIDSNEIKVKPGETIQVAFDNEEEYSDFTVRDFFVRGKYENHYIPSKQTSKPNVFEIKLPTIEESTYKDTNENWFYGKDDSTIISMSPTFIEKSVGNKVDWKHSAFSDALNGYKYELTKDSKWSEIKEDLWLNATENLNFDYPIDIYFYLNGHKLIIDEEIEAPLSVKKGWALHLYNNSTMTAENGKYGEIAVDTEKSIKNPWELKIGVQGSIHLGAAVKFKYINSVDGIVFLNHDDNRFIGTFSNNPEKK